MEEAIRGFCDNRQTTDIGGNQERPRYIASGLFFDECFEVIHGFQTYVTIVPHVNKNNLPVVLLTLAQRDSTEGICRHFQSLVRILLEKPSLPGLWKLPTLVAELDSKHRKLVLDICAESVAELQASSLIHSFPGKAPEQIVHLVKEKLLSPYLLSYREMLRRNVQQVVRQLTNTDPAYFLSVTELLQSPGCSHLDYKKVDLMFKNPGVEPAIREFWQIWGHEQIARKVFPVTLTAPPKLGPLGAIVGTTEAMMNVGPLSHIPVKEGLQSIIKCLKSQDISYTRTKEDRHENQLHSCNCTICRIQPSSAQTSRFRLYGDLSRKLTNGSTEGSAFHLPIQERTATSDQENYAGKFRFSSTYQLYSDSRIRDVRTFKCSKDLPYSVQSSLVDSNSSRTSYNHRSLVQPVPHYFPISLKAFSQPLMYNYPMLNKPHYALALNPQQL
ncbi:uncharacterized protein LOC111623001 [Centruroides sculpturatus]|uniref:uncharacterized protein LOC111623001 n=1 Tax=Centruroides sculpturatus TaxID=218467 RepID=UPI000C6EBC21|nr:uncharacterized protein LOC111623001 [Centruroides sculpturatus]